MTCIFCQIIARTAPSTIVQEWDDALAIVPLGPVVDGHVLVIPKTHVRDAAENPLVSAAAMKRAAELAASTGPCNIIANVGKEAGQTVFHLHVHVVPRKAGDGLRMPWDKKPEEGAGAQ